MLPCFESFLNHRKIYTWFYNVLNIITQQELSCGRANCAASTLCCVFINQASIENSVTFKVKLVSRFLLTDRYKEIEAHKHLENGKNCTSEDFRRYSKLCVNFMAFINVFTNS